MTKKKIHLENLSDFVEALNKAQADIKELLVVDFNDEERARYIEGDFDDIILTLTTTRMKLTYSFSDELREIIGRDDELFI